MELSCSTTTSTFLDGGVPQLIPLLHSVDLPCSRETANFRRLYDLSTIPSTPAQHQRLIGDTLERREDLML
jgi:hypothetical protein